MILLTLSTAIFHQAQTAQKSETDKWREELQFLTAELPKRHCNLFHRLRGNSYEKSIC